jgi:hypothetical protein
MRVRALKEYDPVKIINPTFVMRIGFNLCVADIISSWTNSDKIAIPSLIKRLSGEPAEEVVVAEYSDTFLDTFSAKPEKYNSLYYTLAQAVLKKKNFGGNRKSLHTKEFPELLNATATVSSRKVRKTGTYVPASGGYNYEGEYDYDPAYLANEKTHVLYELRKIQMVDGRYAMIDEDKNLRISKYDEFGYADISMIEKCNIVGLDMSEDCDTM